MPSATITRVSGDNPIDANLPDVKVERARVLFGATGWPAGMIDLASWAKHEGAADAAVFRMRPSQIFTLEKTHVEGLDALTVSGDLREIFEDRGHGLNESATVLKRPDGRWEIQSGKDEYVIEKAGDGLNVHDKKRLDDEAVVESVRRIAKQRGVDESAYFENGRLNQRTLNAISKLGGEFVEKIAKFNPNVIGFRMIGENLNEVKAFVESTRLFSSAYVVVGGPMVTIKPVESFEKSGADFAFAGEAEEPFNMFLKMLGGRNRKSRLNTEDDKVISDIPGLVYTYAKKALHNTLPADGYGRTALEINPPTRDQDWYNLMQMRRPFASQDLIQENRLDWSLMENFDKDGELLGVIGSRGCPAHCLFCSRLHGRIYRAKTVEELIGDIYGLDERVSAGSIKDKKPEAYPDVEDPAFKSKNASLLYLFDADFMCDRDRTLKFFKEWGESPLREKYRLVMQTNPIRLLKEGEVDEELMDYIDCLKVIVSLGGESFNPSLLSRLKKPHTVEHLTKVLDRLDRNGSDYYVFQILADHETTPQEFLETIKLLVMNGQKRKHMLVSVAPYEIPEPGSDLHRNLDLSGRLKQRTMKRFYGYQSAPVHLVDPLVRELVEPANHWLSALQWTEGKMVNYSTRRMLYGQVYLHVKKELEEKAEKEGRETPEIQGLLEQARKDHQEIVEGMRLLWEKEDRDSSRDNSGL